MVKNFKGIVKISEVKNEFDKLIKGLNSSVDEYNNIEEIKNIDYNKAGGTLAQLGYTLTIGGLKQFMQIYDGYCFGCRVFKTGNNKCKPTGGILITKDKIYRIPTDEVSGYGTTLYFNPTTNKCLIAGTTKVTKTVSIPVLTSNNSFGTINATYNSGNAYKVTKRTTNYGQGWNYGNIIDATPLTKYLDNPSFENLRRLKWIFPYPLNFKKGTTFSFDMVFERWVQAKNAIVYVKTDGLSGKFTSSTKDNILKLIFTTDKDLNNIKQFRIGMVIYLLVVEGVKPIYTYIQNLRITPDPTTTRIVADNDNHDNLYKIADLNLNKTTSDKLWLNDLPHSMY